MKRFLHYILLSLLMLTAYQVETQAQMTFRNIRGGRGRGGKGQYMARHVGYVYGVGLEVTQAYCLRAFGTSLQMGWRQKNRITYLGGIMPSVHITEFSKYIQGAYYKGRKVDNDYGDMGRPDEFGQYSGSRVGTYPDTDGYHTAHFSWRYFAIPIYGGINYEFLNGKITPSAQARLGVKPKVRFGVSPYAALYGGCRVALERSSVTPFIGYTFNDVKRDFSYSAVSFGVLVGF